MDENRDRTSVESANSTLTSVGEQAMARIGHYRWVICGLLFFATTVNYVDRQVIGILQKDLQEIIGWSPIDYANIVAAFNAAYALGLLISGRLIDRFGTKIGYAIALTVWSLAGMAHALARTPIGFGIARAALGLGESANFPAAVKSVAEWFPKKERALAQGIYNAGTNVGAVVAPLTVPWIAMNWGWQWAFILTGALGLLWLVFWLPMYGKPEEHPKVSKAELAYIQSDPPDPPQKWRWIQLLPHKQTSAFAIGKYMTDPVWWFYLYWAPTFLRENHGVDLSSVGLPLIVIYVVADVGSIGGGWLSSALIKHGWTVNAARKIGLLTCALTVLPIMLMPYAGSLWVAVMLFSIAAASHQGFSANIFTLTSDMFPRGAVGSVVGVGGMAGAFGGVTMASITGYILQSTRSPIHPQGDYMSIFFAVGPLYLLALLVMHLLAPKLKPVDAEDLARPKPYSFGSFLGFGFVGLILGSFAGWALGIILRWSGEVMLESMAVGALVGIVVGIILGNLLLKAGNQKTA
ncbi:MAG: MFS transporter [Acidobacteria bacterium]|nr:MAG: MFS transporter [Acidobacteriota bacterium]